MWPRLFQNLWAPCATDWVERYPSHVVTKWLRHSPKVAAQHYLMSRDHHFEDVMNGALSVPPVIAAQGPNGGIACDANCDSAGVRTGPHPVARNDRTRCHHSGCNGFFRSYVSFRSWACGRTPRKNQPAGATDGPAGVKKWRG